MTIWHVAKVIWNTRLKLNFVWKSNCWFCSVSFLMQHYKPWDLVSTDSNVTQSSVRRTMVSKLFMVLILLLKTSEIALGTRIQVPEHTCWAFSLSTIYLHLSLSTMTSRTRDFSLKKWYCMHLSYVFVVESVSLCAYYNLEIHFWTITLTLASKSQRLLHSATLGN